MKVVTSLGGQPTLMEEIKYKRKQKSCNCSLSAVPKYSKIVLVGVEVKKQVQQKFHVDK